MKTEYFDIMLPDYQTFWICSVFLVMFKIVITFTMFVTFRVAACPQCGRSLKTGSHCGGNDIQYRHGMGSAPNFDNNNNIKNHGTMRYFLLPSQV